MKRFVFEDTNDVATTMIVKVHDSTCAVSAICHYELATAIAEELIREGCNIDFAEIYSYEYNCYDREYAVIVYADHEENIFVSVDPLYRDDKYLFHYSDVIYVHQDCNSKLLKHVDAEELYEFAVGELDEEDTDKDDDLHTHFTEYTNISKSVDGTPTGFSKSWHSVDEDGLSAYTSYSFMSDNRELLKTMMDIFDIKV